MGFFMGFYGILPWEYSFPLWFFLYFHPGISEFRILNSIYIVILNMFIPEVDVKTDVDADGDATVEVDTDEVADVDCDVDDNDDVDATVDADTDVDCDADVNAYGDVDAVAAKENHQ